MLSLATWFTPSLQTIARSDGRSCVLAAAYRACEKLTDERLGITTDYRPKGKSGLAGNICIGIPNDDIGKLWNDAERSETRVNSTVARELMVPLPSEWTDSQRAQCARGLGELLRQRYGVAVMVSIHRPSKDNNNDHVHILFTTRTVDEAGQFGKKTRILDDAKTGEVKKLREAVCEVVNEHARANGADWYVYAGKFSDVIADHIPTTHISVKHGKRQQKLIDENRAEVGEKRTALETIRHRVEQTSEKIKELTAQWTIAEWSQNAAPTLAGTSEGVMVVTSPKEAPKRVVVSEEATEAFNKFEKATNKQKEILATREKWAMRKAGLEANRPNFFVRLFGDYEKKLAEATTKIGQCEEIARQQQALLNGEALKRLCAEYDNAISHNVAVRNYELRMEKEHSQRVKQEQIAREAEDRARMQLDHEQRTASVVNAFLESQGQSKSNAAEYSIDDSFGL